MRSSAAGQGSTPIGISFLQITHAEETVTARPALASEAERLDMRPGGIVLTIARVYRTDERAVETADIVLPAERYAVAYDVPVRYAPLT